MAVKKKTAKKAVKKTTKKVKICSGCGKPMNKCCC
jgi:hypothetical protein